MIRATIIFFVGVLFLLISCADEGVRTRQRLRYLSEREIVDRMVHGEMNFPYANYVNAQGLPFTQAERDSLNRGLYIRDYMVNRKGEIVKVRASRDSLRSNLRTSIVNLLRKYNPPDLADRQFDCSKMRDSIQHWSYQWPDKTRAQRDENLFLIYERCKLPNESRLGSEDYEKFLFLIKSSSPKLLAHLYFDLKAAQLRGDIPIEDMEDIQTKVTEATGHNVHWESTRINFNSLQKLKDSLWLNTQNDHSDSSHRK